MKKTLTYLYLLPAIFSVLALLGCGGGGSASPATTAEGKYQSTTDNSSLYVLDNGTFYLLNLSSDNYLWGMVYGTGTSTSTTYSGSGTRFAYTGDLYKTAVNIDGTYAYQSSLNLMVTIDSTTVSTFSGNFVPSFIAPAKQSDVTGSYVDANAQQAMTIDASGNLAINDFTISPCSITGTIHPHGSDDIYDATLSFAGTCAITNRTGVAILNGTSLFFVMNDGYYLGLTKSS
jgi:hypothetical protein